MNHESRSSVRMKWILEHILVGKFHKSLDEFWANILMDVDSFHRVPGPSRCSPRQRSGVLGLSSLAPYLGHGKTHLEMPHRAQFEHSCKFLARQSHDSKPRFTVF